MRKSEIVSEDCAKVIGPYSKGIKVDNLIFTTQIGTTRDGKIVDDDPAIQANQCLKNIQTIIHAANAEMDDIAKCIIYLTDMDDFAAVNEVYKEFFNKPYPARTCVQVVRLPGDIKVEIEVIACVS